MPGMPYHLEKGAWGTVFEDFLNGGDTPKRALETLFHLREKNDDRTPKNDLTALPFFQSVSLNDPRDERYGDPELRIQHFQIDWLGWKVASRASGSAGQPSLQKPTAWIAALAEQLPPGDAQQRWEELTREPEGLADELSPSGERDGPVIKLSQRAEWMATVIEKATAEEIFDAAKRYPETGFWHQYYGDVEGILRETVATALEVALGLERPSEDAWPEYEATIRRHLDGEPTPRRLPIELFWKCPQRWFEGWITWRTASSTQTQDVDQSHGQVTVVLATPGSGTPLLERPGFGKDALRAASAAPPQQPATSFVSGGASALSMKGMWVVSHEDHLSLPPPNTWKCRGQGDIRVPPFGPSYVGTGRIVIIEPSEAAGGVLREGRMYEDPFTPSPDPTADEAPKAKAS